MLAGLRTWNEHGNSIKHWQTFFPQYIMCLYVNRNRECLAFKLSAAVYFLLWSSTMLRRSVFTWPACKFSLYGVHCAKCFANFNVNVHRRINASRPLLQQFFLDTIFMYRTSVSSWFWHNKSKRSQHHDHVPAMTSSRGQPYLSPLCNSATRTPVRYSPYIKREFCDLKVTKCDLNHSTSSWPWSTI